MKINIGNKTYLIQQVFKFSWPFLHKGFNIWHVPKQRENTFNCCHTVQKLNADGAYCCVFEYSFTLSTLVKLDKIMYSDT